MEELPVLVDSIVSRKRPVWMFFAAIALGVLFVSNAVAALVNGRETRPLLLQLFLGCICIYGASIQRRLYLSEVGIVREITAWGRHVRRIITWEEVQHISIAKKGNQMVAFFEVGVTGWKVPFMLSQEDDLLDVLDDYVPNVEIQQLEGGRRG